MIPFREINSSAELPENASFWMPTYSEFEEQSQSEEGSFGYFQDTWLLERLELSEVRNLVAEEQRLLRLADRYSNSPEEFEEILSFLESPEVADHLPVRLADTELWEEMLDPTGSSMEPPFYCLELGVAGLSEALSSLGFVPAASCRAHHGESMPSWALCPIVYLCTTRSGAQWLSPLLERAGCGFSIDEERPELLVIEAPSIEHSISLANVILREASSAPQIVLSSAPQ